MSLNTICLVHVDGVKGFVPCLCGFAPQQRLAWPPCETEDERFVSGPLGLSLY